MKRFLYKIVNVFSRIASKEKCLDIIPVLYILTILLFVFTRGCFSLVEGGHNMWNGDVPYEPHKSYKGVKEFAEAFTREKEVLKKVL